MRILLIEDDERIITFFRRGLEAERFRVEVARTGTEGLAKGQEDFDLIILDLVLPALSGIEVCTQLRRARVQTPILMLTARDTVEDKVKGLQAGADDYLTKPFAFEELLARIAALQRRTGYHDIPDELRIADLTLNRETREVRRGDRTISLTAKEFALLELLMSHPNKPLSRWRILDHVWGYAYETQTNTVDVYIGYLRKKIDAHASLKLIKTVRDVGYKISDS
ncbi:MAG: DNA-binding response regulator [Nitrospirae bacterium]|nr:MAG: DNA-binding response regulator [Nitrospirota bacterium]